MPSDSLKPCHIALVLCDNIYTEPSGKIALVGLFNSITVSRFPWVHPRLAVFVSLTGLRNGMAGQLEIVRADSDNPMVRMQGEFPPASSPTDVLDMQFLVQNVTFPEPGLYFINFSGNGQPLASRPFHVNLSAPRSTRQEPGL